MSITQGFLPQFEGPFVRVRPFFIRALLLGGCMRARSFGNSKIPCTIHHIPDTKYSISYTTYTIRAPECWKVLKTYVRGRAHQREAQALPGSLLGREQRRRLSQAYDDAVLYYTILYYTILYYTILYYTILYYPILSYTLLYSTLLYYTILYYTILYKTRLD